MDTLENSNSVQQFKVKDGALAEIGPYSSKVGMITHISLDGLTFRYVESNRYRSAASDLNIWADDTLCIEKIPFKTKRETVAEDESSANALPIKYCVVQFGDLSFSQANKLKHFIKNHTLADRKH